MLIDYLWSLFAAGDDLALKIRNFDMRNENFFNVVRTRFRSDLAELDHKRGWFIGLGIFLIVLGVVAIGAAVATTLVSVILLGWILLVGSIGLAIVSFLTGRWGGFLLTLAAA